MFESDSPDWYPATQSTQGSEKGRKQHEELSQSLRNSEAIAIATPESSHGRASSDRSDKTSSCHLPSESQGSPDLFGSYEMRFSKTGSSQSQPTSQDSAPSVKFRNSPLISRSQNVDLKPPPFNPSQDLSEESDISLSSLTSRLMSQLSGDVKSPAGSESDLCFSASQAEKKFAVGTNNFKINDVKLVHSLAENSLGLETLEELGKLR